MKITKLFIEKMDSKSYVVEEKEFDLDNLNIVVDKSGKHKIMLIRKV